MDVLGDVDCQLDLVRRPLGLGSNPAFTSKSNLDHAGPVADGGMGAVVCRLVGVPN